MVKMVAHQLTARPFSFLLEIFFSAADNLETCKKHREHEGNFKIYILVFSENNIICETIVGHIDIVVCYLRIRSRAVG